MRPSRLAGLLGAILAPFCMAPGCDTSISPVTGGGSSTSAPEPLLVSGVEPPAGRVEVGPLRSFRVRFSEPLDPASVGPEALTIRDADSGNRIPGTFILDEGGTSLVFQPSAFSPEATYCLALSAGLRGVSGSELDPGSQPSGCAASYATFASPPVLQGTVSAEVRSSSSVSLAWEPARDEGADPDDIVYEVYRSGSPEPIDFSAPAQVSPPGAIGELLTGLQPDTEYFIAIRARDPAGNRSDPSPAANVKTSTSVDTSPPVFGGILSLSTLSPASLLAAWEAARDDQDPPSILRYNAYVALASAVQDFQVIAKTSEPGAVEMMLEGLAPDTAYHVVVRAVDTAANEDRNAAEASATTPVSYSLNVAPILTRINLGGCSRTSCHSGPVPDGELDLSSHRGLLAGGKNRTPPAVVPGNGKGSYILWRTDSANPNYRRDLQRMPSGGRALSDAQLRTIERWIDQGALDN